MMILLLACTTDCPPDTTLRDGLCYAEESDTAAGDTAAGDTAAGDTAAAGTAGDCSEETDDAASYPVYIAGTDRRFATIQDAIWGAEDGDVVTVCPGTYYENIDFKGKPITVRSAAGPGTTIIDGQGLASVVTLENYEPAESILEGFTLTNGYAEESHHGGGIYVEWGSPTIRYNIIIRNSAPIAGGVYVRNGAAVVHNNIIAWNSAEQAGGGMVCTACSGAYRYNTVFENDAPEGPVGEWYWGIGALVGNILVSQDGTTGAALRWLEPRGDDFETGYNLLYPHLEPVSGEDADMWPGVEGWVLAAPGLVDPAGGDFTLAADSPARDAGPPEALDPDGSRADLGAFGGPDGQWPY